MASGIASRRGFAPILEQIPTPIFSGFLETADGTLRTEQTRAEIGRPEWWFASDVVGEGFHPPQSSETYLLVRFAFSLTPPPNSEVEQAQLSAQLTCAGTSAKPVVFDLFPREILEESKNDVKVKLEPSLKLEEVEAKIGSIEATIHMLKVDPIITTSGVGLANPIWSFKKHRRHPIIGTRMAYAIIGYPSSAQNMTVKLGLSANVSGRYGLWPLRIPSTADAQLTHVIP
jgi:hypothetical protein